MPLISRRPDRYRPFSFSLQLLRGTDAKRIATVRTEFEPFLPWITDGMHWKSRQWCTESFFLLAGEETCDYNSYVPRKNAGRNDDDHSLDLMGIHDFR